MRRRTFIILCGVALGAGCDPAEEVRIQPLPSLERASAEARAGLPEVVGDWRFTGWELAEGDSASLEATLPDFGTIQLETQRRDSIAGTYLGEVRAPLYGEVRRDSVLALVSVFGPGDMRFLTGRVRSDTVWMELTSLPQAEGWPTGARAAFVRADMITPFVRLRGEIPALAEVEDTLPPFAEADAPEAPEVTPPAAVAVPGQTPATGPGAAPPRPTPAPVTPTVPPATTPTPTPPPAAAPEPTPTPAPAPTPPPPAPEPEPEPDIPLLGVPVEPEPDGPQIQQ